MRLSKEIKNSELILKPCVNTPDNIVSLFCSNGWFDQLMLLKYIFLS